MDEGRLCVIIRFRRDVSLPQFALKAGERWPLIVHGKWLEALANIKAGKSFHFGGGLCLAEDVELVYEGRSTEEFQAAMSFKD